MSTHVFVRAVPALSSLAVFIAIFGAVLVKYADNQSNVVQLPPASHAPLPTASSANEYNEWKSGFPEHHTPEYLGLTDREKSNIWHLNKPYYEPADYWEKVRRATGADPFDGVIGPMIPRTDR